jgi:hypothetical protein
MEHERQLDRSSRIKSRSALLSPAACPDGLAFAAALRRLHGISLADISRLSGYSIATISRAERAGILVDETVRRKVWIAVRICIRKALR